jgi:hypothetical protein
LSLLPKRKPRGIKEMGRAGTRKGNFQVPVIYNAMGRNRRKIESNFLMDHELLPRVYKNIKKLKTLFNIFVLTSI